MGKRPDRADGLIQTGPNIPNMSPRIGTVAGSTQTEPPRQSGDSGHMPMRQVISDIMSAGVLHEQIPAAMPSGMGIPGIPIPPPNRSIRPVHSLPAGSLQ